MKSQSDKIKELREKFSAYSKNRTYEEEIEDDSLILMSLFLSEIEKVANLKKVSNKWIAEKIKTSPSYLSQVFAGYKPLNFKTLAKIRKAMDINFSVTAYECAKYPQFILEGYTVNERNDFSTLPSDHFAPANNNGEYDTNTVHANGDFLKVA